MSNFLNFDESEKNTMFKNIVNMDEDGNVPNKMMGSQRKRIIPDPGMCIKTMAKTVGIDDDVLAKIFINVCTSDQIPAPEDKTIEEIQRIIEALHNINYTNTYTIPMSVGEGHAELDNNGVGCVAYDIVVHPKFFDKISSACDDYYVFFLELIREKLEDKYNILLDGAFKVLKNRRSMGTLDHQFIRASSKPFIQEFPSFDHTTKDDRTMQEDLIKKVDNLVVPEYKLIQDPLTGHPSFIMAVIYLPKVKTAAAIKVHVGEDRILLTSRSHLYKLDLYLPHDLLTSQCGAQFNRITKILTLTLAVEENS